MKLTSKSVTAYYRSLVYWSDKLENAAMCWKAKEVAGIEWTAAEKEVLSQAYDHFAKARDLVNPLFAKRIGELVTREIRLGEKP